MRLSSIPKEEFRNYSSRDLAVPLDFRSRKAHYRANILLAEGGMSAVYLADKIEGPSDIPDKVAIKCLAITGDHNLDVLFRALIREGRHLSVLNGKKGIIRLLDSNHDTVDNSFLVLEFLKGVSLERVLERCAPLDADEARLLILRLLDAFSYSHQMGIVQNDPKPSNVIISPDLRPRLFDFGLGRETGERIESFEGSLAYIPPEKIFFTEYDILPSLDIYPLGILICDIFSGRYPYPNADLSTITVNSLLLVHHQDKPLKLSRLVSPQTKLPSGLDDIVELCLVKDPKHRFQHAGAVKYALESVLGALRPEEM